MIYTKRSNVDKPSILESEAAKRAIGLLIRRFESNSRQMRLQFNFRIYNNPEVAESLNKLFHGKCAYCESYISSSGSQTIDHFRPKRRTMGLNGVVSDKHYWWLVYDWENLYSTCMICNHNKRTRFPVKGRRIKPFDDKKTEKALLIDPCYQKDFKSVNFRFSIRGEVRGLTVKGKTTVDVLKLNREELRIRRREKIRQLRVKLPSIRRWLVIPKRRKDAINRLKEFTNEAAEYSGCIRHYLQDYCMERQNEKRYEEFIKVVRDEILKIEKSKWRKAQNFLKKSDKPNSSLSPNSLIFKSKLEKQEYFTSSKRIKKLTIRNFKILKKLVIEIPPLVSEQESWLVLLGENGSGKSSILQAIALTLIGQKEINKLNLDAKDFVNRNASSGKGYVEIELEDHVHPIRLDFSVNSDKFESSIEEPSVLFLAFGSTRLMSQDTNSTTSFISSNVKNLFYPYHPLPNIISWVTNVSRVKTNTFDSIAMALKELLSLGNDSLILRRSGKLLVRIHSNEPSVPIQNLSAGYQTLIVLALNIIHNFLKVWDNYSIAEGIVVIDELGVHLHPRWKIQIVSTLRKIFPAVNFIVSTHEPLCLRGIEKGEVLLLKRDENNKIYAIDDLPSPKNLTIEQLITSKYFGLVSTFDPEIEKKLNAYYLLKSKKDKTAEDDIKIANLKNELDEVRLEEGFSRMDLTRNAVDQVLIEKMYLNPKEEAESSLDEEVINKLKSIW